MTIQQYSRKRLMKIETIHNVTDVIDRFESIWKFKPDERYLQIDVTCSHNNISERKTYYLFESVFERAKARGCLYEGEQI